MRNRRGFTILETMIATVLLTFAGVSFYLSFYQAEKFVQPEAAIAANYTETNINTLLMEVRDDTWATGPFRTGGYSGSHSSTSADGTTFTHTYTTANLTGKDYRKLEYTTSWS